MEETNLNPSEGVVDIVTPQETEQVAEVNSEGSEVATEQPKEKFVQSAEDNARFAEVRRKTQQETEDKVYANLYEKEYGIKSKAEYESYVAKVREAELLESLKEDGADSEAIKDALKKEWESTDPRLQEYNQIKQENHIKTQFEALNNDLIESGIDITVKSLDDLDKLANPDKMAEYVKKGYTLAESYFLANKKDIIAKQTEKIQGDTIRKIQANGEATTGSLSNNGETTPLFTREQVDGMSVADINKNYDLVMKSMKTWK